MPEIGTSGLMSGDGKRGDGLRPQATAPILDSTIPEVGSPGTQPYAYHHEYALFQFGKWNGRSSVAGGRSRIYERASFRLATIFAGLKTQLIGT
jgi:hypothetical protein